MKSLMDVIRHFEIVNKFVGAEDNPDKDTITLDRFCVGNSIQRVDFIKMDVEGMEGEILNGATNILKTMTPKMAICTYHKKEDKVALPEIILKANPAYTIVHGRSVMYCYVKNKKWIGFK